jgi:hypothetical protein
MLRERAATQMTLGAMIAALEKMPPETEIDGIGSAISYRGYYSDLAFQPQPEKIKAGDLLAQCRAAMGQVFEGYKGGDFVMGALTPVWIADYGCCGRKIMAINPDGTIETADDDNG